MHKLFGALALLSLSACGDVYDPGTTVINSTTITTGTSVTINYGTHDQNRPLRHEMVFSCSSPDGLRDYLFYGETDYFCTYRSMTSGREIDRYNSYQFGWVSVYEFMVNGWYYYTYKTAQHGVRHYY